MEKEPCFDQDQELECMDKTLVTVDFLRICKKKKKW